MSEQLNRIESLLVGFIDQTNQKFDIIDNRLNAMDQRFERIEDRLDGIDTRLDGMDRRLDGMDSRFDQMQTQLDRIEKSQNDDLIVMLHLTNSKIDEVKDLAEHTFKEQALMKFELDKLKPIYHNQANHMLLKETE